MSQAKAMAYGGQGALYSNLTMVNLSTCFMHISIFVKRKNVPMKFYFLISSALIFCIIGVKKTWTVK